MLLFVSTCRTAAQYSAFLESLEGVFDSAGDPIDPLGDFNTHVGNDSDTRRAGIWRNSLPNVKPSGILLLDFGVYHGLSIINTKFMHEGVHQCTWHQDRRSMIDFSVISSDCWRGRKLDRPSRLKCIVRVWGSPPPGRSLTPTSGIASPRF